MFTVEIRVPGFISIRAARGGSVVRTLNPSALHEVGRPTLSRSEAEWRALSLRLGFGVLGGHMPMRTARVVER